MKVLFLSLLSIGFICGFTFFNDCALHQTILISHHMPAIVYAALILFLIFINPFLFKLGKKFGVTSRELVLVLALTLAACTVPGFGLMRTFGALTMLPHYHNLKEPGWKEEKVITLAPKQMLADISKNEDESLNGFIQGMSVGTKHMPFSKIPWYAWKRTLLFWLPLVLTLWIGIIALAVVVHPQWSNHEQLPYPIAKFADSLLPKEGETKSSILTNRFFIVGCVSVVMIYLINYVNGWYPNFISVDVVFNLRSLAELFPNLTKGGGEKLFQFAIEFTPLAFSYFLTSDVGLSLGIGPFLWCWLVGIFANYGVSLNGSWGGTYLALNVQSFISFGAYAGFLISILFWGRFYYKNVLKRAFLLPVIEPIQEQYVWGARVFIAAFIFFVAQLVITGLDWQLAVLYSLGAFMIFLVMGRIVAETGLFFIQAWTFPCVFLWGLLGAKALGPQTMLIMFLVSVIILLDPRESLMPYVLNSLKLVDMHRIKISKTAVYSVLAIIFGLAVAIPVTFYFHYDKGSTCIDGWTTEASGFSFNNVVQVKQRLTAQGELETSQKVHGMQRFAQMVPNKPCMIGFVSGLALVLLFSFGRIRFSKWPLHPVMFLVWATYPANRFCQSFLIGWAIKGLVVKYGGENIYRKLKPLMYGLIAGDMLAGGIPVAIGLVYYFITGEVPRYSPQR